jgi:hypothetical protein
VLINLKIDENIFSCTSKINNYFSPKMIRIIVKSMEVDDGDEILIGIIKFN